MVRDLSAGCSSGVMRSGAVKSIGHLGCEVFTYSVGHLYFLSAQYQLVFQIAGDLIKSYTALCFKNWPKDLQSK